MMRYLVLAGDIDAAIIARIKQTCAEGAAPMTQAATMVRAVVLVEEKADVLVIPHIGMVLGKFFDRAGDPILHFSDSDTRRIRRDGMAALCEIGWGPYIALGECDLHGAVEVLRDPSAAVPCYHTPVDRGVAIASHVDLLFEAAGLVPQVDRKAVFAHLFATNLRTHRTCLTAIDELTGGELLEVCANATTRRSAWSPWDHATLARQHTDYGTAVDGIRLAVSGAVKGLAHGRKHCVLGVSGGLDSSIVASMLVNSGADVTCMTIATREPRGDERSFARVLASHLELELMECFEDPSHVDLAVSCAAHLPRPTARGFAQSSNLKFQEVADAVGADAFFSGGGGDNVFYLMQNVLPVIDCLRMRGWSRSLWDAVVDVSMVADVSMWEVMRRSAGRIASGKGNSCWPVRTSFLDAGSINAYGALPHHPWLDSPDDALPGKAAHIALIMHIQNYVDGHGVADRLPTLWPLLSQPVMEACLRSPTWMWFRKGRDRAVARDAFADVLPKTILNRRSKGSPEGFVSELFHTRRAQIQELLSTGVLASYGFLHLDAIRLVLETGRPATIADYVRIMFLVDVEAWLRSWNSRSAAIPAISLLG